MKIERTLQRHIQLGPHTIAIVDDPDLTILELTIDFSHSCLLFIILDHSFSTNCIFAATIFSKPLYWNILFKIYFRKLRIQNDHKITIAFYQPFVITKCSSSFMWSSFLFKHKPKTPLQPQSVQAFNKLFKIRLQLSDYHLKLKFQLIP